MTPRKIKRIAGISVGILSLLIIAGYSYYQARNLINGPELTVISPISGTTTTTPLAFIEGEAKNVSYISLNNRQMYVDKDRKFHEELLLSAGYNVWKLEARDKFGRTITKTIELVLRKN
jgi:hypothetical protein